MRANEIKLSENQLAELFQNNSKNHTSQSDASDFLSASAASSNRLNHLEDLIDDHSTAQALKVSIGLNDWSHVMAKSIEKNRQSWFNLLGMNTPFKTAFATVTFAFVFAVAIPTFTAQETRQPTHVTISQQNNVLDDVISINKFDQTNDRLSKGSFESNGQQSTKTDRLFNTSFGVILN